VGGVQIGSGTTGLIKLLAERIELFGNIDIVNLNTDYIDSTRIFVNNLSTNKIEPSVPSADLIFGSELTSGALRIGSDTSRTVLIGTTNASVVNISTANISILNASIAYVDQITSMSELKIGPTCSVKIGSDNLSSSLTINTPATFLINPKITTQLSILDNSSSVPTTSWVNNFIGSAISNLTTNVSVFNSSIATIDVIRAKTTNTSVLNVSVGSINTINSSITNTSVLNASAGIMNTINSSITNT
jgi:hypothetical protein